MFMNEKLEDKLRLNTKHYSNLNFEESVKALDKFFFLISNKNKELNEENLLELAEGNYDKFKYWSFEKFLKAFCEIVKPDEYKQNKGSKNFFEKLYKEVFSLVPPKIENNKDFSLSYAAKKTIEKFDSYEKLSNDYPYICEFVYLYGFRNKDIVHNNEEITPEENGRALKCLCVCILYLCSKYENILREKACFERFRRELKPDWKKKCDSVYQEMTEKIGYVDFKWESKTRHTTEDIALQNSEKLKNETWLKLVGMAGSGKTTALKYINHLLLENYDNDNIFPIFFELQELEEAKGDFLLYMIEKCYDVSELAAESLKETDKLIFLLDGYDEIKDIGIQRNLAFKIEKYAKEHKSVRIIMTDRTEKNLISVLEDKFCYLRLCEIGKEDKKEYFEKNCKDEKTLNLLINSLENDPRLSEMLKTPLKLEHFVEMVKQDEKIPLRNEFLEKHLAELIKREKDAKKNINPDVMKDYLKEISYLSGSSNKPLKRKEVLSAMAKVNEKYGYEGDKNIQHLELAVSLGILEEAKEESYEFFDPDYLEYYRDLYYEDEED